MSNGPGGAPQDARTRLVCNPLRFAANYAVLAAAATALALCALARPLELLLGAAVALALFAGGSQRFFDAAWPHLHRWAVFDIMGEPLLVDGVCVKLNGRNVGDEQTLWGLPRLGAPPRHVITCAAVLTRAVAHSVGLRLGGAGRSDRRSRPPGACSASLPAAFLALSPPIVANAVAGAPGGGRGVLQRHGGAGACAPQAPARIRRCVAAHFAPSCRGAHAA